LPGTNPTMLFFTAALSDVDHVLGSVLSTLPGIIDGPVTRSVLASYMDTVDLSLLNRGARIRMETDQHDDRHGGWVNDRTGAAGRWVVQLVSPASVSVGGARHCATLDELLGPYQGGAPLPSEPLWEKVCGESTPEQLHVVSLCRIERRRWVAHDGDGLVFAEVVVDNIRSLGTQEATHELVIRFDCADAWTRHQLATTLIPDEITPIDVPLIPLPPPAPFLREPSPLPTPPLPTQVPLTPPLPLPVAASVATDPVDDGVVDAEGVSSDAGWEQQISAVDLLGTAIHTQVDALISMTRGSSPRQIREFHSRHMVMLEQLVQLAKFLDADFSVFEEPLAMIALVVCDAVVADVWVRQSRTLSREFRAWAREQRRQRVELVRSAVSSLIEDGHLATFGALTRGLTASAVASGQLDTWLAETAKPSSAAAAKRLRKWKRASHPATGRAIDALVESMAKLCVSGDLRADTDHDDQRVSAAVRSLVSLRTYGRVVGDLRQTLANTQVDFSIAFEAGMVADRLSDQARRRTRKAVRRAEKVSCRP
jgi:hypothetical protein